MGEIADGMLNGTLCQYCGVWMGNREPPGFPTTCNTCLQRMAGEDESNKDVRGRQTSGQGDPDA